MSHTILGLDIGGANLKAATNTRQSCSVPFALWRQPEQLASQLAKILTHFPEVEEFAITMTGELCDCFANKAEGVRHILQAVRQVALSFPVRVWSTEGRFLNVAEAADQPRQVAAANWHALATYAGGLVPRGVGLLIDIGSTTTDLIPILDGEPWSLGKTDPERMMHDELIYTGAKRTPLCALLPVGQVAAELFATIIDAYLLLGLVPESPTSSDTADSRPENRSNAIARVARLYCADPEELSEAQLLRIAEQAVNSQQMMLNTAIRHQITRLEMLRQEALDPKRVVILSGSGEWLARRLIQPLMSDERFADVYSLSDRFGADLAAAAPAFAVATLAAERAVS